MQLLGKSLPPLSCIGEFLVIACNSAFTYKGRPVDVRQVGRELDVRSAIQGRVRRVGERVSTIGRLVKTEADRHFWAGRVEGDIADLFDQQDEIAEMVASAAYPSARKAEMQRARKKKPDNLAA
jgi:adenylate cyclase